MPLDVVIGMELLLDPLDDHDLHLLWFGAREVKHGDAVQPVLPFREFRGKSFWQMPIHPDGRGVLAWAGNDIAGRALQHGHMGGIFGKRWNQRHRGSATSNDNDAL